MNRKLWLALIAIAPIGLFGTGFAAGALAETKPAISPELAKRLAAEKDARRACKIEICKAFATPSESGDIACSVTKTFLRENIIGKITGGSYVWGYGHTQCKTQLKLDRAQLGKALSTDGGKVTLDKHTLNCDVDDKDAAKGKSFTVAVTFAPTVTFEKGKATKVDLGDITTEGSNVASAAVTAVTAVDKVSGYVSRAAAKDVNDFLFSKCKDDGVEISPKS